MDYHKTVLPYLNTNPELDALVEKLWGCWRDERINIDLATRTFLEAASKSPNIQQIESYVAHCLLVSRKCSETGTKILDNYDFLKKDDLINPLMLEYMGLTEDSVYLIGGNGKNNENGEDSNPYHEILTFIQLEHMGYKHLAESMALHFVAPEILTEEQKKSRFKEVSPQEEPNLVLEILTGIDAVCTTEYLPLIVGSMEEALNQRIKGLKSRRGPNHPLVKGLENGGEERLKVVVQKLEKLRDGEYSLSEIKEMYSC